MLCTWWDQQGVVCCQLLQPNGNTGDRYRLQLMRLSRALKEKRPQYDQRHDKVILQHDNAQPHVARPVTPRKLTDRCTDQKPAFGFFHRTDQYFLPYRRKTDRMTFSKAGFPPIFRRSVFR